ncbi:hypothetical protein PN462_12305 [Spirulina sp. CS-785/01]|uniref:hypothetical protein n=1 Tax=Spirulina sp. CS-785/01 TaxID=3021716 RepID=UPI00233078F9|nr:hypothetical protein [Spirulina sp. CS-785/01]MDB9313886.1 hypothetical protein [Spirulina sp. CS-785/01]
MPYVTSIERSARQEGIEQGIEQGILRKSREDILEVLEVRFKVVPEGLRDTLNQIEQKSILTTLHRQAITVDSPEAFQSLVNQQLES